MRKFVKKVFCQSDAHVFLLCVLVSFVFVSAGTWLLFTYFKLSSSDVASWVQAVASVVAIRWAGRQGTALLRHRREMEKKAAIELAVSILRSVHGHIFRVGRSRWWDGEKLRKVVIGESYFEVEYLGPIEKMFDQVNLGHLDNPEAVEIMVSARAKIWRLRELLDWITKNGSTVEQRVNKEETYDRQARHIVQQVSELRGCLNQLIQIMNSYERLPVVES